MRYSVIMPVYNKASYVEAAVASALSQALLYELIIIDDGSTDGSGDICDRLAAADNRVTVIHQSNSGVSAARNVGIFNASGDYVCFLDGDDLLCEGFFDTAERILRGGDYDMLFFAYEKTYKSAPSLLIPSPLCGAVRLSDIGKFFYEAQDKTGYFGVVTNKLTKTALLKDECFNSNLRLAEDFDFWLKIYPKIKTAYFSDFCCFKYENLVEGSSCFDKVDYFSQLIIRIHYRLFLEKCGFEYNEKDINALICKYKYFCIFYADSHIAAAKHLRKGLHLPVNDTAGLPIFERTVLWLCSHHLSALASCLIGMKKFFGRIKRWIRRK